MACSRKFIMIFVNLIYTFQGSKAKSGCTFFCWIIIWIILSGINLLMLIFFIYYILSFRFTQLERGFFSKYWCFIWIIIPRAWKFSAILYFRNKSFRWTNWFCRSILTYYFWQLIISRTRIQFKNLNFFCFSFLWSKSSLRSFFL